MVGWWCGDGMTTHTLGRKYDLIDVGRADRRRVRADKPSNTRRGTTRPPRAPDFRHHPSRKEMPPCRRSDPTGNSGPASTRPSRRRRPATRRSWGSCRSPHARSSSPPRPREESQRGLTEKSAGQTGKSAGQMEKSAEDSRKSAAAFGPPEPFKARSAIYSLKAHCAIQFPVLTCPRGRENGKQPGPAATVERQDADGSKRKGKAIMANLEFVSMKGGCAVVAFREALRQPSYPAPPLRANGRLCVRKRAPL